MPLIDKLKGAAKSIDSFAGKVGNAEVNIGDNISKGFANKTVGTKFVATGKSGKAGTFAGSAANFTTATASRMARNILNPQNIAQGTAMGGAIKGAAHLATKSFNKVPGGPSIEAPLGIKMKKGVGIGLGSAAAVYTVGSSYNQYSNVQRMGSVEAQGPLPQLSYDNGTGVRDNLSATGDLVFAMNNLKHRGF
jgi:hypothetical protein